jgi:uncharacterized protein YjbI with pentapeptide repeats
MPRLALYEPRKSAPRAPKLKTDLKVLADAANEAAKREAAQWFFFITIMVTLAAIVGSTTHRRLFLEEPVRVPLLSLDLPLVSFYWVAPAFFVVLHFYLLAQLRVVAGKVHAFLNAAETQVGRNPAALQPAVRQLDAFAVVQVMAAERLGERAWALRAMVWTTLVIAPVLLLLFFQLRFLPYHDEWTTWWHRLLLLADLMLLWNLWPHDDQQMEQTVPAWWPNLGVAVAFLAVISLPAVAAGVGLVLAGLALMSWLSSQAAAWLPRLPRAPWLRFMATFLVAFFSAIAAIPPTNGTDYDGPLVGGMRAWLFDRGVDPDTQRPLSLFSRNLVLPDEVLIDVEELKAFRENPEKAIANIARTRVLRGRDLRNAVLDRADLRRADLTAAVLHAARLNGAKLAGAHLDRAQMQGARLESAQLRGARLEFAQLQGAWLVGAQMQGARLELAQLQGARLDGAQMQGAWLVAAQMQGARLEFAQLQGALLFGAQMQGALLVSARMQGARLDGARMQGASLRGIAAWSLIAPEANLDDTAVAANKEDFGWAPCAEPLGLPRASCRTERSWSEWIALWSAMIPDGPARDEAEKRLAVLTRAESLEAAELRQRWTAWPLPDPEIVANRLAEFACDEQHAPHVARGLLRQVRTGQLAGELLVSRGRDLGPHARIFARRLTDPQTCPGARGLTDQERVQITQLATFTMPLPASSAPSTLPNASRAPVPVTAPQAATRPGGG